MKIRAYIFTLFVITAAAFHPFCLYAQEAGIIEDVHGRAYWRKDRLSKAVRLDPQRDKGRLLRSGESVRCEQGGRLQLRLYSRRKIIRGPSVWFPIPYIPKEGADLSREVLEEYGRLGGRDRGILSVYAPSNRSKVRPAAFVIRWVSQPFLRTLIIREISQSGREIWRDTVVNSQEGELISDSARQALGKYRIERGHGPLFLILWDSNGEIGRLTFSLLSEQDEQFLEQELAFWDKEPEGIWRRLGRARAFIRYRMYTEAAEEYDAALAQAPQSTNLLTKTISAHVRTGNSAREEELRRRLPK